MDGFNAARWKLAELKKITVKFTWSEGKPGW